MNRNSANWKKITTQLENSAARLCCFVLGRQQPLHQQLFGAVAGGGEKAAADQAGPEAVAAREELGRPGKAEIEHLEFVRGARPPRCTCAQPPGI